MGWTIIDEELNINTQTSFLLITPENKKNAIVYFNKAIALDSTRSDFYMARANTKLSIVDYQGAIADYTKVIQLDPKRAGPIFPAELLKFI